MNKKTMSQAKSNDTEIPDEYREVMVEAEEGRAVQIEEYPGGGMTIYASGGDHLFLMPDQASALRTALGKIDGGKRRTSKEEK